MESKVSGPFESEPLVAATFECEPFVAGAFEASSLVAGAFEAPSFVAGAFEASSLVAGAFEAEPLIGVEQANSYRWTFGDQAGSAECDTALPVLSQRCMSWVTEAHLTVHLDTSAFNDLNLVRNDVRDRLCELRNYTWTTTFAPEGQGAQGFGWFATQALWRQLRNNNRAERVQARERALEHFGLAHGEEARRIATEDNPYWANRIEALIRRELFRLYLEICLRFLNRAINRLLRPIRLPAFVRNVIVLQAPWYVLHGEHPPHESDRSMSDCDIRAGVYVG